VRFAFDEQQLQFRAQLRSFAEKECPPDAIRTAWEQAPGWSRDRWAHLAELGVTAVTVPESHGGLGLGFVDLVLLLEEAGYSGLPEPLLDVLAVAVPLLAQAEGTAAEGLLRDRVLRAVAEGGAVVGVVDPASPSVVTAGAELVLVPFGDEIRAVDVPDGAARHRLVDGTWRAAAPSAPAGVVVAEGARARQLLAAAADHGALGAAAVLVGAATRMLVMAADYARQRVQFGKPIGSFQAVKHHLAGALVRVEFAKPLVYRAAWSLDEGDPDAALHCAMAKAAASDAARRAARAALQVHGAIGYTWEHDLHLWMKRAWVLAGAWGDAGHHRATVLARA